MLECGGSHQMRSNDAYREGRQRRRIHGVSTIESSEARSHRADRRYPGHWPRGGDGHRGIARRAGKVLEEGEHEVSNGNLAWDDKQEREWVKLAKKVEGKKWTREEKFDVVRAKVKLDMLQKEGLTGELADRDIDAVAKLVVSVAKAG